MNMMKIEGTGGIDGAHQTALSIVTIEPEKYVAEVYQPFRAKLLVLVAASEAAKADAPDVATVAGMEIAIRHRAAFRDEVRIAAEKSRVERKAPIITIGKLLDARYKEVAAEALPHEAYWDSIIKAEDQRKEDVKAAKITEERARTDAIQARITAIRNLPASTIGKSGAEISQMIYELAGTITEDDAHAAMFEEFAGEFKTVRADVLELLASAEKKQLDIDAAARQAEAARIAEAERLAAEKIELARQRAENERIANEQAAERQRLADAAAAQEAAALKLRQQAEDNARAERDAQAKVAAEAQAKLDAQAAAIAEQSRKLAEQQAAADARDAAALEAAKAAEAAAIAKEQDEARREADHGPALMMNAEFDVARDAEIERQRLQALAAQAATDAHAPASDLEALMDANADDGVSDAEIIAMVEAAFCMTRDEAIDRLQAIDFDAARAA